MAGWSLASMNVYPPVELVAKKKAGWEGKDSLRRVFGFSRPDLDA